MTGRRCACRSSGKTRTFCSRRCTTSMTTSLGSTTTRCGELELNKYIIVFYPNAPQAHARITCVCHRLVQARPRAPRKLNLVHATKLGTTNFVHLAQLICCLSGCVLIGPGKFQHNYIETNSGCNWFLKFCIILDFIDCNLLPLLTFVKLLS